MPKSKRICRSLHIKTQKVGETQQLVSTQSTMHQNGHTHTYHKDAVYQQHCQSHAIPSATRLDCHNRRPSDCISENKQEKTSLANHILPNLFLQIFIFSLSHNQSINVHKFRHHTAAPRGQPRSQLGGTDDQVAIEGPTDVGRCLFASLFLARMLKRPHRLVVGVQSKVWYLDGSKQGRRSGFVGNGDRRRRRRRC